MLPEAMQVTANMTFTHSAHKLSCELQLASCRYDSGKVDFHLLAVFNYCQAPIVFLMMPIYKHQRKLMDRRVFGCLVYVLTRRATERLLCARL